MSTKFRTGDRVAWNFAAGRTGRVIGVHTRDTPCQLPARRCRLDDRQRSQRTNPVAPHCLGAPGRIDRPR